MTMPIELFELGMWNLLWS